MKKILSSKNIVTVLGLALLIAILFFFYTKRVNDSISPVTVPYAKKEIASGNEIKNSMVGTTQVPPSMISDDVLRNLSDVVGKYVNADSVIPQGSLFYKRSVVSKESLPYNVIYGLEDGYTLYNLSVNVKTTYGNSIYPGNYIDIYVKASTREIEGKVLDEKKVIFGKLLENVKVIAVKDDEGNEVFENLDENRTPSVIVFAIPNDYYLLLKKAEYLRTYSSQIIPVPQTEKIEEESDTVKLSSDKLKAWIEEVTLFPEQS